MLNKSKGGVAKLPVPNVGPVDLFRAGRASRFRAGHHAPVAVPINTHRGAVVGECRPQAASHWD